MVPHANNNAAKTNINIFRYYTVMFSIPNTTSFVDTIDTVIVAVTRAVQPVVPLYNIFINAVSQINYQYLTVNVLVKYSEITSSWQTFWKTAYNTNICVKYSIDIANYIWRFLQTIVTNNRIEPFTAEWTSISKLDRNPCNSGDPFYFHEYYYYECDRKGDRKGDRERDDNYVFSDFFLHLPEGVEEPHQIKCLMMRNTQNQYLVKAIKADKNGLVISKHPSSVKFLSIEYKQPKTNTVLPLSLDPGMYMEFNELFTPTFVRRLLEYQHNRHCCSFDTDYTLAIMDNNINFIELSSSDYVMLEKDSYKVKTFV